MTDAPAEKNKTAPGGGLVLPAYVTTRADGVYISLTPPPTQEVLQLFVDRLFASEARFVGLDYALLARLLYDDNPLAGIGSSKKEVRIAANIVRFPPERTDLYKGVKISRMGDEAEYMFAPAFIETVTEEPVYGEPGEDGSKPVIDHIRNVERRTAKLDFDEFVASMWLKGVRFGIDTEAVQAAIRKGEAARLIIARQRPPSDSRDAEVVEESDSLRPDNAPLILPNGKADLRKARNRFPQVTKDTPLLRKIPRALGNPGYTVTGSPIEPRAPLDINMNRLSGPGTRIDLTPKGEVLVADMDGFIIIEEDIGRITVSAKIENKGGISAKSTGDIVLGVDEFTEHGEVQEGRIVEGKHMTFLSDVFGSILSKDGNILIKRNLSGGRAQSIGGSVTITGRTINATVIAWEGDINIEFAEGCLIMGKNVTVKHAVNCELVAETLQLGTAEGCGIAGKALQIASTDMRKHRETVISVLLPDIAEYNRQIAQARTELKKVEDTIQARNKEISATQRDPGFARYLAMDEKVRSGQIKFTPEQQAGWQKIVNQFAPLMRGTEGLVKKRKELDDEIRQLTDARDHCDVSESCKIDAVHGDTLVRKQLSNLGMSFFKEQPEAGLRISLHQMGTAEERIFSGSKGTLDWRFTPPATPAA